MKELLNVTVCGCGSGGLAMAADLSMLGCRVNLYEVPAFKANLQPIREQGGIRSRRGCRVPARPGLPPCIS